MQLQRQTAQGRHRQRRRRRQRCGAKDSCPYHAQGKTAQADGGQAAAKGGQQHPSRQLRPLQRLTEQNTATARCQRPKGQLPDGAGRKALLQQKQEQYDAEYNARRHSQVGTGDRSERIRTYNFPQGRVTDHRIGLTIHKLDEVLDGNLDLVVEPLILADQEARLRQRENKESDKNSKL